MIQFNVEFKGKGAVLRSLSLIKDGMTRQSTLRMLADEARALIKVRTLEGLDENDRALIPSKRAKRDGGQTLSDKGHMLGSMRVLSATKDRAVIGFGSTTEAKTEAKKAWWAQDGTKPHIISAKNGKALAFASSMSTATHMRGSKGKSKRITMGNARSGARGLTIAQHVHHPGTPKRPFFGISPRDGASLRAFADDYVRKLVKAAEAQR